MTPSGWEEREKSAIAEHVHSTVEGHDMDWKSLCIIDGASWNRERKIREALHIGKRKPSVNTDSGIERSMDWDAILGDVQDRKWSSVSIN